MARAQGARAQMALAFETVYGTAPASGYTRVPFASTSLGAEQPLISSELLGYGRDPAGADQGRGDRRRRRRGADRRRGLRLLAEGGLRRADTTGTGPWTHEFRSGGWTLPSLSIETAMPEVPRFAMYSGCVLDQLSWQHAALGTADRHRAAGGAGRDGRHHHRRRHAGRAGAEALRRTSTAASPATARRSATWSRPRSPTPTTSTASRPSASDGRIDGADPSIAALTGRVEVRFADQVLVNQAIAGDPCELEFGYALPSGESFTFTVHAVYLPRPRIEIAGPQGVQATFDWQAARDADARAHVHRHPRQRRRGVLVGGTEGDGGGLPAVRHQPEPR